MMETQIVFYASASDLMQIIEFGRQRSLVFFQQYKEVLKDDSPRFHYRSLAIQDELLPQDGCIYISKNGWKIYREEHGWIWISESEVIEASLLWALNLDQFGVMVCRFYAIMDYYYQGEILEKSADFRNTVNECMYFIYKNTTPVEKALFLADAYRIYKEHPEAGRGLKYSPSVINWQSRISGNRSH